MLVCNWLHSVEQNHFHVMMLLYRGSIIFRSLLIQSYGFTAFAHIPSQRNQTPCIRPNDEICHPDTRLSKHHPSG
jgi:hypothetical protein